MNTMEMKTKNVNNKRLLDEIDTFMLEVFTTLNINWKERTHREEFAFLIDDFMENFAVDSGKIVQFDVMCDGRNNTTEDVDNGIYHFTIRYKQKNCFNTTEIDYTITA